jgi:DNA-binding transcriptional ArsR family regulator
VTTYQDSLTALADPTRRRVFEILATRPMSVAELAEGFSVSRPAISQHLKVLKQAGLVSDRPDGTRRIYQLDPGGLSALRDYLDGFWESALAAFKAAAQRDQGELR